LPQNHFPHKKDNSVFFKTGTGSGRRLCGWSQVSLEREGSLGKREARGFIPQDLVDLNVFRFSF
jgi:hypothetical protein